MRRLKNGDMTTFAHIPAVSIGYTGHTKSRHAMCPAKTRALSSPTLLSTAPPTFADFQDYACQSLEGAVRFYLMRLLALITSSRYIIMTWLRRRLNENNLPLSLRLSGIRGYIVDLSIFLP